MKRYFGAKDSGYIIPGHGGVLDRFDSFMLVLPVLYYFIYFWR
ncbi:MAG TPA: phosphatidate cytidylyltransferase [Syntrophomonas sp.]|nr:phosphatidate cytidylyltransferase [Syntrophomonas sp.]